jgi:hypothetical protein
MDPMSISGTLRNRKSPAIKLDGLESSINIMHRILKTAVGSQGPTNRPHVSKTNVGRLVFESYNQDDVEKAGKAFFTKAHLLVSWNIAHIYPRNRKSQHIISLLVHSGGGCCTDGTGV